MNGSAIDLFAGAGGATQGIRDAGLRVIGAVEFDSTAAKTYRLNHPETTLWETDIRQLPAAEMMRVLKLNPRQLTLLKACPPCQGFSTLAEGRVSSDDPRNELVRETVRFVRALRPLHVMIENVPGLGRDSRSRELKLTLHGLGYAVRDYVVDARDFGVPQRRRRYILLATRGSRHPLPETLGDPDSPRATVRSAFEEMADEGVGDDPLMAVPRVSQIVQDRIEAVPVGGTRFDLPRELQLECHRRLKSARDAGGAYGRLRWDEAAPTMTTRCTTPSCGPFVHPDLNRPITLREAATIQTFPPTYQFAGTRGLIERQIGNAVPVRMATQIVTTLIATSRDEVQV
ncbi:DNA cytosine methyltransferase [Microbacterium sp. bgisy189]|uniref:DNA cytosine methyltransferase n=1 Tax=Microbacterium sp. bgisy189 TaxID=3413798 RepID=UPI003EBB90AC